MTFQAPRMTAEQSRAWMALVATAELLPAALDAQLQAESHLTHFEFLVLGVLKQSKGNALRFTDLAAASNSTLPRLSKVIRRMERRGLVKRTDDAHDRRSINVRLEPAGRRVLVRATPAHIAQVHELVLDALTPDQITALAEALEPVVARLDPERRLGGAGFSQ